MKRSQVVLTTNPKGEVLLLQRSDGHPMYPLEWCFPGGKLDFMSENIETPSSERFFSRWEDYAESAAREFNEEIGYHLTSFEETKYWLSDNKFIVKVFQATVAKDPTKVFPNREHIQWGWFNHANLPDLKPESMTAVQLKRYFSSSAYTAPQKAIDLHG